MIEKKNKAYFAELNYSIDEHQTIDGIRLSKNKKVEVSKELYEKLKNDPNRYVKATTFIGGMAISPMIERVILSTQTLVDLVEDVEGDAEKEAIKSEFAADIGDKKPKPRGKPKKGDTLEEAEAKQDPDDLDAFTSVEDESIGLG